MTRHFSRLSLQAVLFTAVTWMTFFLAGSIEAQGPGVFVGPGEDPWSENSRNPFEIHMTGVINPGMETDAETAGETTGETTGNTDGRKKSIAVVTLGIAKFRETYQFEIVKLEAPGNAQLSTGQILQKVGKRAYDFDLIGVSALLSKVAQSEPGTPLRIVGMYRQYNQQLQLLSVDIVGMDKY